MTSPLILASASESRRRMLADMGVTFTVMISNVDEEKTKEALLARKAGPAEIATSLAELKALAISKQRTDALILGADQLLVCDGGLFAKAKSVTEAKDILRKLRGRKHELVTAAALARNAAILWRHVETATLWMRDLSETEIDAYARVSGDALLTCVGGYRIEEEGAKLFTRMEGDQYTIQGLPLAAVLEALRTQSVAPQ